MHPEALKQRLLNFYYHYLLLFKRIKYFHCVWRGCSPRWSPHSRANGCLTVKGTVWNYDAHAVCSNIILYIKSHNHHPFFSSEYRILWKVVLGAFRMPAERHGHPQQWVTQALQRLLRCTVSDQSREPPIIKQLWDKMMSAWVHTVYTWKGWGSGCLLGQHLLLPQLDLHKSLNDLDENCANLAQANEQNK